MRTPTKLALAAVAALTLVAVVLVVLGRGSGDGPAVADTPEETSTLIRDDSHVVGEEGSTGVTVVEFLDFECEACLAAYPLVEQLRVRYAGEVTFVVRYFPIPSHFNAERAARAVESAARQGQFEAMYKQMYETQTTWSEQRVAKDDVFREFAEDLGLDMAQFDRDYDSQDVLERIRRDVADGTELGVQGTPTFFVDGEPIQPQTPADFAAAIDTAIAAS